ncbi:hypothetical protein MPSEU_000877900 [Mayamaea pseudoterrestris]|nr:hypothetical protein MPSEU_000877900 [Mayamaea pseudoterrestris]
MSYRMKDDTSMSDDSYPPSSGKFPSMIDLLRCHAWLGRFVTSGSDELLLQAPNECQAFIHAFHRLKHAHLQPFHCTTATAATMYSDTIANITVQAEKIKSNQEFNVLQSTLDDDIAFKILDYLTSQSLVQVSKTCNRLNVLCKTNAHLRSFDVALARQLTTPMQRLRAKEQIQGISNTINDCHVPIPSLLLRRRIVITDCGDPEYNGVYHCTGCNGNGYSFTKPRDSSIIQNLNKYERRQTLPSRLLLPDDSSVRAHDESFESDGDELQDTTHRETLRCMLAKRFSNEVE